MAPPSPNLRAIVIVEDPSIQRFVHSVLESAGQDSVECDAGNAMDLVNSGKVKLMITNTPGVFARFAQLPMLYVSQCPDPHLASAFPNCRILCKPFRAAQLLEAVGEIAGIKWADGLLPVAR